MKKLSQYKCSLKKKCLENCPKTIHCRPFEITFGTIWKNTLENSLKKLFKNNLKMIHENRLKLILGKL